MQPISVVSSVGVGDRPPSPQPGQWSSESVSIDSTSSASLGDGKHRAADLLGVTGAARIVVAHDEVALAAVILHRQGAVVDLAVELERALEIGLVEGPTRARDAQQALAGEVAPDLFDGDDLVAVVGKRHVDLVAGADGADVEVEAFARFVEQVFEAPQRTEQGTEIDVELLAVAVAIVRVFRQAGSTMCWARFGAAGTSLPTLGIGASRCRATISLNELER